MVICFCKIFFRSYTPLPYLTDDYKRLICYKVHDQKKFEMAGDLSFNAIIREFTLRYDYNDGEIFIVDVANCSSSIISKFRLNVYADSNDLIMVR